MNKVKKNIPKIEPNYDYVFGYLEDMKSVSPNLIKKVLREFEISLKWHVLKNVILRVFTFEPKESVRYIFIGRRFNDLIRTLPREEVLVVGFSKDWLYCLCHQIPFRMGLPVSKAALDCYATKKLTLSSEAQEILKCGVNAAPKFVIFSNDSLPIERIFCLLAKSLGMHTVCIQDGIFQSSTPAHAFHGGVCDLMLAFNKHQFELLEKGGIPKDKLDIVGFNSNIQYYDNMSDGLARRVCILGQPWGVYSSEIEVRYHALLERLCAVLGESGFKFVFKPHPDERGAYYLGKYGTVELTTLKDCLATYDVFIGFNSTALIEASLAGRVAIQIFDSIFLADRFSDFGYAHSIDSYDLTLLSNLVGYALPMNISYSETISARFKTAIQNHHF